jgi:hypothetical protein
MIFKMPPINGGILFFTGLLFFGLNIRSKNYFCVLKINS